MKTRSWGPWTLNKDNLTLEHPNSYYVDLERCRTSAEMLDWIFQISGKRWATEMAVAGLVNALHDLLDPQATLCSFGQERGPLSLDQIEALCTTEDRESHF